VLKPGGRLAISDVVATSELPEAVRNDVAALVGCMAGTATVKTLTRLLEEAGFETIEINVQEGSRAFIRDWMPGTGFEKYVASATIEATKPRA